MTMMLNKEAREDLMDRGYSRRQLAEITALVGAGVAASSLLPAAALAQQQAGRGIKGAVRIGANECWTGPFPSGVAAATKLAQEGNRYEPDDEHAKLFAAVASVEGIPADRILAWPGSSDPLSRVAVAYASPTRGIVTANPTYEAIWRTGDWIGAPVKKVPLTSDYRHDVKAMLAADPNAGVYYICSPNNPTGTVTPIADIEWLANNKPKDYQPRYAILLDMVGGKNPQFPREGTGVHFAPEVVEKVWDAAAKLGYGNVFINDITGETTDDHLFINQYARIPAIDIVHYNMQTMSYPPWHHRHSDNMDVIDPNTLKMVGTVLVDVLYNEMPAVK